jgi:hypothetical protein
VSRLDPSLRKAAHAHATLQYVQALERHGKTIDIGDRQLDLWEARWERELSGVWPGVPRNVDQVIAAAARQHARVEKDAKDAVYRSIVRAVGGVSQFVRGAYQVYMRLATDTSEGAGQHALDLLGLNQTWRWANPRDMARDMFSVRGSKIIQHAYGNHIDALQKMIVDATDPAAPKTQAQVRREIKERWGGLRTNHIKRIARTETATVWETTNLNVEKANGVTHVEWLIARGPSIGPPKSFDVCKECLDMSTKGPYEIDSVDPPPKHPNCRCTLIPSLEHDWLPPAETWNGVEPGLPLIGAPDPTP